MVTIVSTLKNFNELLNEKSSFDIKIQNRLKIIKKH